MDDLEKNICKAKKLIAPETFFNCNINFFDRIYPFSNENIVECFNYFELKGKKCLSVLSSSDQVFDMFLNNVDSITAFDTNPLTEYYFYLKLAALRANLSLKEYLKFFCYRNYGAYNKNNYNSFNIRVFSKISQYLKGDNYKFWIKLFETYDPLNIRNSPGLFFPDEEKYTILKNTIGYLNPENYCILQEKAQNIDIDFIHSDIYELPNKLNKKFDYMYLSNIIQYAKESQDGLSLEENHIITLEMYKRMIYDLSNYLTNNGQIIVGYIFTPDEDWNNIAIFNKKCREKIFDSSMFSYKTFTAMQSIEDKYKNKVRCETIKKDACLVYTKNSK